MATKKCANGHQYDSGIYGDNCPFCPSGNSTKIIDENPSKKTQVIGAYESADRPTETIGGPIGSPADLGGGGTTKIRRANTETGPSSESRLLVGVLVSYDQNPLGEVYKIYEGRNVIGRAATSDIPIPADGNMSSQHLLILYREAEGVFWAVDQNSSNGTYINGVFVSDRIKLNTNDLIVVGATKLTFLAIPR